MTGTDPSDAPGPELSNEDWTALPRAERSRDLLIAAGIIGGMIAMQLILAGGGELFSRDFWLDEIFTYRIASDPSFLHSMRAVQAGIDLSPPGYQVLARGWTMVFGVSETSFRALAFATMMVFLAGLYLLLRLSAHRLVCCAAVLAVWSHPLIIEHAFDARFYGPWLAAVVWFCYFWQIGVRRRGSYAAYVGLAACSLLACSFHYFGIFSLGLIVGGELLLNRPAIRNATPLLMASLAGPLALAVYVPLFWMHQVELSDTSWVRGPNAIFVMYFAGKLLFPRQFMAVMVIVLLNFWLGRYQRNQSRAVMQTGIDSSLGLVTTILMIPLLIGVSLALRPVIFPKYAIPVVACIGPAVVVALRGVHRYGVIALILALTCAGVVQIASQKTTLRGTADEIRQIMADIDEHTRNEAIFFETPHDLYKGCFYAPHLSGRCYFLDFEKGELPFNDSLPARIFNRDYTRVYSMYYPEPALYPWSKIRRAPAFYLVLEDDGGTPPLALADTLYTGFTGRQVAGRLYLMRRIPERDVESSAASSW